MKQLAEWLDTSSLGVTLPVTVAGNTTSGLDIKNKTIYYYMPYTV